MKKQINPTIKAHLIRGAFYLILLVAVCAIPFALAGAKPGRREDIADGVTEPRASQLFLSACSAGGRPSSTCSSYNPSTNTWTQMGVTLPDTR